MALTEHEKKVLRDLEEQLYGEDSSLADRLSSPAPTPTRLRRFSPRNIGAGIALLLTGLATVVVGVSVAHDLASVVIGVVGFLLAVWGVTLALTTSNASLPGGSSSAGGRASGVGARGRWQRFMAGQEQRWDDRRSRS